jgi:hypothetical protein
LQEDICSTVEQIQSIKAPLVVGYGLCLLLLWKVVFFRIGVRLPFIGV